MTPNTTSPLLKVRRNMTAPLLFLAFFLIDAWIIIRYWNEMNWLCRFFLLLGDVLLGYLAYIFNRVVRIFEWGIEVKHLFKSRKYIWNYFEGYKVSLVVSKDKFNIPNKSVDIFLVIKSNSKIIKLNSEDFYNFPEILKIIKQYLESVDS